LCGLGFVSEKMFHHSFKGKLTDKAWEKKRPTKKGIFSHKGRRRKVREKFSLFGRGPQKKKRANVLGGRGKKYDGSPNSKKACRHVHRRGEKGGKGDKEKKKEKEKKKKNFPTARVLDHLWEGRRKKQAQEKRDAFQQENTSAEGKERVSAPLNYLEKVQKGEEGVTEKRHPEDLLDPEHEKGTGREQEKKVHLSKERDLGRHQGRRVGKDSFSRSPGV